MGFSCGIVGLPNVGKSTIFNALSKAQNAESANYPFCTIEPNKSVVPVPDKRMEFITSHIKPKSIVPTTVEFVDIAGLVKGASKGEGRGNEFLTHIKSTDAIVHVVRCFEDDIITHVEGKVDPIHDVNIINTELMIADLEILERAVLKLDKLAKKAGSALKTKLDALNDMVAFLSDGRPVREYLATNPDSIEHVREYNLITAKPMLYVANVSEDDIATGNKYVDVLEEFAKKENSSVIIISGKTECDILELSEADAKEYMNDLGVDTAGLDKLIMCGYEMLGLITYFTAGEKEVRAWTISRGDNAQTAAGKIHSDIERGFIRAEVVSYSDFVDLKSLVLAKEKGKMRLEGKEYIVQDGDIIYFRYNV